MEASDEEFDTEEVRKLVKRLDELDPIPLPWKSDEEALKDFWDYCEERQREERIIAEMKLRVEKSVPLEKVCGKIYIEEVYKSEFVERFPELSLFFKAYSLLDSEMICIFPYLCPYAESAREIREIFS